MFIYVTIFMPLNVITVFIDIITTLFTLSELFKMTVFLMNTSYKNHKISDNWLIELFKWKKIRIFFAKCPSEYFGGNWCPLEEITDNWTFLSVGAKLTKNFISGTAVTRLLDCFCQVRKIPHKKENWRKEGCWNFPSAGSKNVA